MIILDFLSKFSMVSDFLSPLPVISIAVQSFQLFFKSKLSWMVFLDVLSVFPKVSSAFQLDVKFLFI